MSGDSAEYFKYLRSRSYRGLFYRKYWLYPRLVRQLGGRVLDVGCGIGDFLAFRPGTAGVDVNPHAVAWCQQHGLDARLMSVDVLPFQEDFFDSVVLDNVLEHLAAPTRLMEEIHRVLTPGGKLLIGVPGERGFAHDPDHKKFYDESELLAVTRCPAFKIETFFYMPLKCEWLSKRLSEYCLYGVFSKS